MIPLKPNTISPAEKKCQLQILHLRSITIIWANACYTSAMIRYYFLTKQNENWRNHHHFNLNCITSHFMALLLTKHNVVPHFILLCHLMLRCILFCYIAMPFAALVHVMFYYFVDCYVTLGSIMPHGVFWHCIKSCNISSCNMMLCYFMCSTKWLKIESSQHVNFSGFFLHFSFLIM